MLKEIFGRFRFEEDDLSVLRDSPSKFLLQRTLIYSVSAAVLIALWGILEHLFIPGGDSLFLYLRLAFSALILIMLLIYRSAGFPVNYINLIGALTYYPLIGLNLSLIIMSTYNSGYLLGFATIFYGTAVLMVWPLRFMIYSIFGSYVVLGTFSLYHLGDVEYFLTLTFLGVNVGGLSFLASWISWRNFHSNKTLIDQLNQLTLTDKLTGLNNRRYFDLYVPNVLQHAIRSETDITVMMLDVDFFKNYNDNYGHQEGDVCLQKVAEALNRSLVRKTDFLARYGGEEFVIVLPDTGCKGSEVIARRIISNMAEAGIVHEFSSVAEHVTLSIGISCCTAAAGLSVDKLVREADTALYKAKQGGRNRFVYSSQESG